MQRYITRVELHEGNTESPAAKAEITARDTKLPIARELAEMLLTQIDINNSLASLTLWSKLYNSSTSSEDEETKTILGSLFRDGITQFVACFDRDTNAFPLLVETVFPAVEGIATYFRWLRALRNSYAAHRHGAARQCAVGVAVDSVTGEFLGTSRLFASYRGPNQAGHADLLSLIGMAARYVAARVGVLAGQFEAEARALSPETLLNLPLSTVEPQAPTDMRKSRGEISARAAPSPSE